MLLGFSTYVYIANTSNGSQFVAISLSTMQYTNCTTLYRSDVNQSSLLRNTHIELWEEISVQTSDDQTQDQCITGIGVIELNEFVQRDVHVHYPACRSKKNRHPSTIVYPMKIKILVLEESSYCSDKP